jgi:hypothetical protein
MYRVSDSVKEYGFGLFTSILITSLLQAAATRPKDTWRAVYEWLCKARNGPVLLVLENVEDVLRHWNRWQSHHRLQEVRMCCGLLHVHEHVHPVCACLAHN